VFSDSVQHHLQFCIDHLNCDKMAACQFYLQSGKQKSRVGGGQQSLVKNSLMKRKCAMVHRRDATGNSLSSKFGVMSAHFHAVTIKHHSSMWNWPFGLSEQNLCEQSSWCQLNWWARSWICSSRVSRFLVLVSLDFLCMAHAFYPEHLSNQCQGLRHTPSRICKKFYATSFVRSIAKSHQARYTTTNKRA
jgi:hypothetical protein